MLFYFYCFKLSVIGFFYFFCSRILNKMLLLLLFGDKSPSTGDHNIINLGNHLTWGARKLVLFPVQEFKSSLIDLHGY